MNKLKVTILTLSLVTVMAGAAVSPALGVIAAHFSDVNPLLIKLIVTIPSLSIIATSLLFGVIAKRLSSRSIAAIGMLLYIAGGAAGLANNIYVILLFRVVLGIGVGLVMPLSTGLIAYLFDRKEQSKLMGYSVAMNNLGGIIATVLSGYLVSLHWRYTFTIYLLGIVILVLVLLYLPKAELSRTGGGLDWKAVRAIAPYLAAMFTSMAVFCTVPVNFSIIAIQEGLLPVAAIGAVMSVLNLAAFLAGLQVHRTLRRIGRNAKYLSAAMLVAAFFCLSFIHVLPLVILGLMLLGGGIGTMAPILNSQIALHVEKEQITSAMALVSAMLFLGQFLSPIVFDGLQSLFGMQSLQAPYYLAMGVSAVLLVAFAKIKVSV